jgi:hypothetical protein
MDGPKQTYLDAGDYQGVIVSMNSNIQEKFDSLIGGKPNDEWIVQDLGTQKHLCQKVDSLPSPFGVSACPSLPPEGVGL